MNLCLGTNRLIVVAMCVLISSLVFLTVCDGGSSAEETARKAEAQRHERLQAQLEAEQAQRLDAERSARAAAESSRDAWIIGLGAGAGLISLVMLLLGIHVGSRALTRHKEKTDG